MTSAFFFLSLEKKKTPFRAASWSVLSPIEFKLDRREILTKITENLMDINNTLLYHHYQYHWHEYNFSFKLCSCVPVMFLLHFDASHIEKKKMFSMLRIFSKMFLLMKIITHFFFKAPSKIRCPGILSLAVFFSLLLWKFSVCLNTCPCSISFFVPEFDHLFDSSFTCSHRVCLLSYSYLSFVIKCLHFWLFLCFTSCLV